jgi:uncharacterized membrane protein
MSASRREPTADMPRTGHGERPLLIAAVLLGVGLGGFFDGIVLHQILQWHHMVSSPHPPDTVPNLRWNVFWDGLFHASTWLFTLAGLLTLRWVGRTRRDIAWSAATLVGGMLLGWGGFNVVEGIVDHHLLAIHHVKPGPHQLAWDLGFLLWGAAMMVVGWAMAKRAPGASAARRAEGRRAA